VEARLEAEQHELVDLRLQLELELSRRQARADTLDHVDEVAHAFEQLEPGVVRAVQGCFGRNHQCELDSRVRFPHEERLALALAGGLRETADVRGALELVVLLETALDALERSLRLGREPLHRQWTPPPPRNGTKPCVPSDAAISLEPCLSQRS